MPVQDRTLPQLFHQINTAVHCALAETLNTPGFFQRGHEAAMLIRILAPEPFYALQIYVAHSEWETNATLSLVKSNPS